MNTFSRMLTKYFMETYVFNIWKCDILKNTHTSSRWHSITESFDGSLRDDNANGEDDDKFMVLTPMSQPVGERLTFPPNARPSIWSNKHDPYSG